eukprot:scaffold7524_cov141-Skeletonema_menzelii.AAC.2
MRSIQFIEGCTYDSITLSFELPTQVAIRHDHDICGMEAAGLSSKKAYCSVAQGGTLFLENLFRPHD